MKHLDITIKGKVQNVGFRYSTKDKAETLGLTGYVMNLPDGGVFIEAEGAEENLEKLVAWCKEGPLHASVEQIDITEKELKKYQEFAIKL